MPTIHVTTAAEGAAADAAAIAAGTPSRALMQRAGAAAAAEVVRRFPHLLAGGVAVHAGPGNNGGDAWVVARALHRHGARVGVRQWGADAPATDDARFERERARADGAGGAVTGAERVIVDGVLGTGARPPAREYVREYVQHVAEARGRGCTVIALDVPTGLDATTGASTGACVRADLTLAFGTLKRGLLVSRDLAGAIVVLDIGLPADVPGSAPVLWGGADVASRAAPPFGADAHKGDRGKIAVVGGAPGMAGAALLASDAALRSGAGMVRAVVASESVGVLQTALPAAMAAPWPADDDALDRTIVEWADAVLVGPGLGRSPAAAALVERVLAAWRGPVVLDADALNHFAGQPDALAAALGGRTALLTPHPLEFARLAVSGWRTCSTGASRSGASSPRAWARPSCSRACRP
jgi:NAD(P)H-hydrate epimerase